MAKKRKKKSVKWWKLIESAWQLQVHIFRKSEMNKLCTHFLQNVWTKLCPEKEEGQTDGQTS